MLPAAPKYVYGAAVSARLKRFQDCLAGVQHQHQRHFQELPSHSSHPVATLQEYVLVLYNRQPITLICRSYWPRILVEDTQALFARIVG